MSSLPDLEATAAREYHVLNRETRRTAPALIHRETFRVRAFESEPTGRATPGSLCRFAQETADCHCRGFGMSLLDVRAQSRMWIMTRFRLLMQRYPHIDDMVTVETWASSRTNGIRAVREFCFLDSRGEFLGSAGTVVLLMDEIRKRPLRMPQAILDICNPERSDGEEFEVPRLKPPQHPGRERTFEVGWKELDSNNHTNHVNYVEWALEALPLEMRRDQMLAQIDIEFLAEAFYGDQVRSEVEIGEPVNVHQLKNGAGTVLSLAVTRHTMAQEA